MAVPVRNRRMVIDVIDVKDPISLINDYRKALTVLTDLIKKNKEKILAKIFVEFI